MVETRSGTGATAQTSFWALAFLIISAGLGLVQDAGDDQRQMLIGLGMIFAGIVIIFAKYYIKIPDASEKQMRDTIAVLANTYESLIKQAQVMYSDVHRFRDEVVKHRA
jgi:hypothetical protein